MTQDIALLDRRDIVEPGLKEDLEDVRDALEELRDLQVVTAEDRDVASGLLQEVDSKLKSLGKREEWATEPMKEALKRTRALFKPTKTALEEAKKILKEKIQYSLEQEEAEATLALQQAGESGDKEAIVRAAEGARKPEGVIRVSRLKWRVVDESLVPREYLCVDDSKVSQVVKKLKERSDIPGIEVFYEESHSMKGRRR